VSANDPKHDLLKEAMDIVVNRGEDYGPPSDHFTRTIGAINAIFADKISEPFTATDWAMFMIIDKAAREQERPKRDNLLDIVGYAACANQCRSVGK
jgi:hypothetical protein